MTEKNSNLDVIVKQLSSLSVMDAAKLSKLLEEEWGVSAAVPVAAAAPSAGGAEAAEAQTEFDVILSGYQDNKKVSVIKEVRAIDSSLNLIEAKAFVEGAPKTLKSGVSKAEAEAMKSRLEAAGGEVKIS